MALEYAARSGCLPLMKKLLDIRSKTKGRLSHIDVQRHEAKRKSKRSTWVDIADDESAGNAGAAAGGKGMSQRIADAFAAAAL